MLNFTRWFCGFLAATSLCSEKHLKIVTLNSTTDLNTINFNQSAFTTSSKSFYFDFQDAKVMLDLTSDNESSQNEISKQELNSTPTFPETDSPTTTPPLFTQTFLNLTETEFEHAWLGVQNFTQNLLSYSLYNQTSLYLAHHRSMLALFYLTLFCLLFTILSLVFLLIKICFKRNNQDFVSIKKSRIYRTPTKAKRSTKRISETDERCYLLVPNAEEDEEEVNY